MPEGNETTTENTTADVRASRVRATLLRAGIAGVMALAFVGAASLFEPGVSSASEDGSGITLPEGVSRDLPAVFYQVDSSSDLGRSLGEIKGRKFRIEIVAGRGGEEPTYRVLDADGNIVAEGLRADEVYSVDPDLTVDRMGDYPAEPSNSVGPLMLLTPATE
ncbi:MAG: hypothetical protein ACTS27_01930 [Phycisphaerales bacterium]